MIQNGLMVFKIQWQRLYQHFLNLVKCTLDGEKRYKKLKKIPERLEIRKNRVNAWVSWNSSTHTCKQRYLFNQHKGMTSFAADLLFVESTLTNFERHYFIFDESDEYFWYLFSCTVAYSYFLVMILECKRELLTYEGTLIKFRLPVNKNDHIWTLSLANDGKLDW